MSHRQARNLGIAILVISYAGYLGMLLLLGLTGQPLANTTVWALPSLAVLVLGVAIVSHEPSNPIGWLCFLLGQPIGPFADAWATTVLVRHDAALPGANLAAWLGHWASSPSPMFVLALIMMLYPDGRPLSARWRIVFRAMIGWAAVLLACCAFSPSNLAGALPYPNPFAAAGSLGRLFEAAQHVLWLPTPIMAILVIWSQVSRFKHVGTEQREQLKWMLWAVGALVADIVFWLGIDGLGQAAGAKLPWIIGSLTQYSILVGVLGTIFATAVAMLKYHLYDIDLIINRTIVYLVLTAGLILAYTGCVLLLQHVLDPVTRRSDLAIALSTLAVAGLFHPARSRVQNVVDRRFYRQRYDAEHALEQFGSTARNEVDLEQLTGALANVIAETVQPEHVSVWVRSVEESAS